MTPVLQLNLDYTPMKVTSWERAIEMLLDGTVLLVDAVPDRFIRSERLAMPWPSVVALRKYRNVRNRVRFSGRAVLARDHYRCAYCLCAPTLSDGRPDRNALTMDHVVPRAQAREGKVYLQWAKKWVNVTCWENAITACRRCNQRKGNRTPEGAGMHLHVYPRVPSQADVLRMQIGKMRRLPDAWLPYLPGMLVENGEGKVEGRLG